MCCWSVRIRKESLYERAKSAFPSWVERHALRRMAGKPLWRLGSDMPPCSLFTAKCYSLLTRCELRTALPEGAPDELRQKADDRAVEI